MPRVKALLLACAVATPVHAQWQALQKLTRSGANVTAEAYDLDTHQTLQRLNSAARLAPASLTKLTVAAATLEHWTPDKSFITRIFATGKLTHGEVSGDLVLVGAGDPTLEYRSLLELAAQIKSAGISSVGGRVIVDLQPFPAVDCETHDRCEALVKSTSAYNAPLAAVGVDYGNWCVSVQPTSVGERANVRGCGVAKLPIDVQGAIQTVASNAKQTFWIERATHGGTDELHVGGNVPSGSVRHVYRSMSNSALGVSLLLRQTLTEIGVHVGGAAVVERGAELPADAQPLAQTEGLLLREELGRMLRFSNNYIADVLALDLAADLHPDPGAPATLADAGKVLADYLYQTFDAAQRTRAGLPPLFSGSGLTPENRLSADDLVTLLTHEYRDARLFPAFYGGLVVPRQSPFGFLRQGSSAWLDRVALKTGTMEQPVSVCGIAGYLRKRSGGWIAFAAIVNGSQQERHVPLAQSMQALRSDIETLLARE